MGNTQASRPRWRLGALPAKTPLELATFVRELNAVYERVLAEGKIATGALLAVGALSAEAVQEQIASTAPDVVVAMDNCANQLVVYGQPASIAKLQQVLTGAGAICMPLPFDRGYHTPHFAGVSAAFAAYYGRIKLRAPRVPLYSARRPDCFRNGGRRPQARSGSVAEGALSRDDRAMVADWRRLLVEVGPRQSHHIHQRHSGRKAQVFDRRNLRRPQRVEHCWRFSPSSTRVVGRCAAIAFDGRRIAAVDRAKPVDSRPYGVLLDNTCRDSLFGPRP